MTGAQLIAVLVLCVGLSQQQDLQTCPEVKFIMYYSHIQYEGHIVNRLMDTFPDCLGECRARARCLGVSYDKFWRTCYIHTQENVHGKMFEDKCCIHARKACSSPSATDAPPQAKQSGLTPTPKIEVGKDSPPPYDLDQTDDFKHYPVYENTGYDYDFYEYEPERSLDINDPKEGSDDTVDTEAEDPADGDREVGEAQDDLARTRSTLPPTQQPTARPDQPIQQNAQSKDQPANAQTQNPVVFESTTIPRKFREGTTAPSVLEEAPSPPSSVFTSYSKFTAEQIQLLIQLGLIKLPGVQPANEDMDGEQEEDKAIVAALPATLPEVAMSTTAPVFTTPTEMPKMESDDALSDSDSEPSHDLANSPTPETFSDGPSADDSEQKPASSNADASQVVPTLEPELFEKGIGNPVANVDVNRFVNNPQVAGPPGMSNFAPPTRAPPTDAPGHEGEESQGGASPGVPQTTPRRGMERTTPPSLLKPPAIPDSGKCPDPFERVAMSAAAGGILQDDLYDVELCKARCLEDEACSAADFNNERLECYLHLGEVMVENVRAGTASCCDHFRKTQCKNVCYQHIPVNVAAANQDTAECIRLAPEYALAGLATSECPGLCGLAEILSISADGTQLTERSVFRQCNNNPGLKTPGCITSQSVSAVDGHTTFTLLCSCQGTRCNALATAALMALQLHFPLDHSVEDTSPYKRHGNAFNITYSNYDSQMINSAVFNGSACIKVRPLMGYLYGSLQAYELEKQTRLTITMWIRRSAPSGYMSLLSTGPSEGPIDIVSIGTGARQIIQASVNMISGLRFVTTKEAPLDKWLFIALVIGQSEGAPGNELQLYVGDEDLDSNMPSDSTPLPPELLQSTTSPLYLGAKPGLTSAALVNFFVGMMDEVRMFSDALPPKHLQSIRDSAREEAPEPEMEETTEAMDTTDGTTEDSTGFTDSTGTMMTGDEFIDVTTEEMTTSSQ